VTVHMWCYCQGRYGFCAGRETATAKTISVVGCQAKILLPMERRSLIFYLPFEEFMLVGSGRARPFTSRAAASLCQRASGVHVAQSHVRWAESGSVSNLQSFESSLTTSISVP